MCSGTGRLGAQKPAIQSAATTMRPMIFSCMHSRLSIIGTTQLSILLWVSCYLWHMRPFVSRIAGGHRRGRPRLRQRPRVHAQTDSGVSSPSRRVPEVSAPPDTPRSRKAARRRFDLFGVSPYIVVPSPMSKRLRRESCRFKLWNRVGVFREFAGAAIKNRARLDC